MFSSDPSFHCARVSPENFSYLKALFLEVEDEVEDRTIIIIYYFRCKNCCYLIDICDSDNYCNQM